MKEGTGYVIGKEVTPEEIAEIRKGKELKNLQANVVLFSYNRPRMVREAARSVLDGTYPHVTLWLLDDGSDFDIYGVAEDLGDNRVMVCAAPRVSASERVNPDSTRFPDNTNFVMEQMDKDGFVTFLCDDDILHPDWLKVCNDSFNEFPSYHTVNGQVYYFSDGEDPIEDGKEGFLADITSEDWGMRDAKFNFIMWWQVGSFSQRLICFHDEEIKWAKARDTAHSWDIEYTKRIWEKHPGYLQLQAPSVYRREHDAAMSRKLGRFTDRGYVASPGEMTENMVKGWME